MLMQNLLKAVTVLSMLVISGCGAMGPRAPLYPGESSAEPEDMRPVEHNGFEMALPPDWEIRPVEPHLKERVKVRFGKKNTSINGSLQCNSPLLPVKDAGIAMEEGVLSTSGNARMTRGPYALSDSTMAPVIRGYEGTVTSEGQEVEMSFWIAHNIADMSCQYGVLMAGTRLDMKNIEPEFVAIVRSMQ